MRYIITVILFCSALSAFSYDMWQYKSPDTPVQLSYPAYWTIAESADELYISNSARYLNADQVASPGAVSLYLLHGPADAVEAEFDTDDGLRGVQMAIFQEAFTSRTLDAYRYFEFNTREKEFANAAGLITPYYHNENDVVIASLRFPEHYVVMVGVTRPGEIPQHIDTILAILDSVQVSGN
ncbi:hypothetical protein [Spirochaeta africana]|nr:hypothetical protein [Spirochaeta africana]